MSIEINGVDVQPAKDEIGFINLYMHLGVIVLGALVVALFGLAVRDNEIERNRLMVMLAVSLVGLIAQGDHKIARLGHWMRYVENFRGSYTGERPIEWETRKSKLRSRKIMMPLADLLALAAPVYVVFGRVLPAMLASDPAFLAIAGCLLVLAIFAVFLGQKEW